MPATTRSMSAITRPTKRAKTSPQLPDDVFRNIMSFIVDPYREDRKKHARIWQTIQVERVQECEEDLPMFHVEAHLPEHMAIKPTREMCRYMDGGYVHLFLPNGEKVRPDGMMFGHEEVVFILDGSFVWSKSWNGEVYLEL